MLVSIFQNLVGSKTHLDLAKESLRGAVCRCPWHQGVLWHAGCVDVKIQGAKPWLRRGFTSSSVKCLDQVCRQWISNKIVIYCCNKVRELKPSRKAPRSPGRL